MRWHCLVCWEEFTEEDVGHQDDGIGPYEYGGVQGWDSCVVEVCPSCGESVETGRLPSCWVCGGHLEKREHDNNDGVCSACLREERP